MCRRHGCCVEYWLNPQWIYARDRCLSATFSFLFVSNEWKIRDVCRARYARKLDDASLEVSPEVEGACEEFTRGVEGMQQ